MEGPRTAAANKARDKILANKFKAKRSKNQASRDKTFASMHEATTAAIPADLG